MASSETPAERSLDAAATSPVWGLGHSPGPVSDPLDGELSTDVAIVGGGLTGLWTAWYLRRRRPDLDVTIIERHHCGHGASGRNGGWCSSLFPLDDAGLATRFGRPAAAAMDAAMRRTVDDVLATIATWGADAGAHKGGMLFVARDEPQERRVRHELREPRVWLTQSEVVRRVATTDARGAVFDPDCAVLDPVRLVHAVRDATLGEGVRLIEGTTVRTIIPGAARCANGTVRARTVIRCTEGYTADVDGHRRDVAPLFSLMVATDVLSDDHWSQIGLSNREAFTDGRRVIIYGQRTSDGRLAFGGRGAPYRFGSRTTLRPSAEMAAHRRIVSSLIELFPMLESTSITHRWSGVLGATRDWTASVGLDPDTGLGWAGGYVGDGVATTNLAGRTLAALVDRHQGGEPRPGDDALVSLPWVDHRSRRWEPEPLRWLGIRSGAAAAGWADRAEVSRSAAVRRSGNVAGSVVDRLTGHGSPQSTPRGRRGNAR